jgi:hypothetical protein
MLARPVTQTPDVDMKSASTKVSGLLEAENGSHRARAPSRMTAAKLRMKMRAGGRCLEKKSLTLTLFMCSYFLKGSRESTDAVSTESGVKHSMAFKNCQGGVEKGGRRKRV